MPRRDGRALTPAAARQIAVAAAGMATFLNLYSSQALLPTLSAAFNAPLSRVGLTVTAPLLAVALVAPFVGTISDLFGRKSLIAGAALALTLPTLASAFAPSLSLLILARFAQGLLLPFIFAVTVAYINEECPGAAGVRVTGTYAAGTIFGGFSGRFISGWAAELIDWRAAFVILAGATAACALLVTLLLPREIRFVPAAGWRSSLGGFRDHLANRRVLATCAIGFGVLFSIVATFTYANFHLSGPPYNLGPADLGSMFAVYLLGIVATPLASRIAARAGRRIVLCASVGLGVAGLLLTLLPSLSGAILGLAVLVCGMFTEQTLSLGFIAAVVPRGKSTAVGLYVTCYYIGGSLGGVLPAGVYAHAGWAGCVALVVAVQLAMLGVALFAWRDRHGQG